ncbi:GNAT family N-acetyltransferase [Burkholderia aenigmatica]|uniref:GNAT family N-acetyltransferase n=1 Tax=Burkholderia aenigmatica TaxID=2015348 RepID=UPI00264F8983|nr:GNAT family N-acetyltransferase [Burkholderia aenigmatica]MDN7879853.1 GNAT family N-acetyltransferase [Burkholderia aenigmatica]
MITSSNLAIRDAQPSDHAAIAALLSQLGYDTAPSLILAKIEALLPSPTDTIVVAVVQHEVVGSISLHAMPLFHAAGYLGRITSLVVDERHRGSGVGSALMAAAERWFDAAGCVKLEVTSGDHRPDAHRFYARHGFLRDGQRLARTFPHHAASSPDRM